MILFCSVLGFHYLCSNNLKKYANIAISTFGIARSISFNLWTKCVSQRTK